MAVAERHKKENAIKRRSLKAHQTITLSLLFLAGIVNFLDRASLSVANTTIRAEMHLNGTQMGLLLSAFSLAYGQAQLPLIGVLDKAGTRKILGGGLLLWSSAQMLTGMIRGLPAFLVLRVMLGVGEAPFYPCGVRSVREWFTDKSRGRATAFMSASQTIGLAVAPPVLTLMMLRIGWHGMFIVLGGAGLVVAFLWIALHRSRGETEFREVEDGAARESVWKVLLRQRMVYGMMLGFGGINYTNWLYTAWLPGYLQSERHLSLAKSGWVAAIPFLAGGVGMMTSGTVADWFARRGTPLITVHRRNLVVGMVLSAAATLAVAHSGSTAAAVAGISAALFCIHFAGTSGWGLTQAVAPGHAVAALGALQNFAAFMIASAAPVITGMILDETKSFSLALSLCSAVTLLGALSYATLAAPPREAMIVGEVRR